MKISNRLWFIVIFLLFIISLGSTIWLYYESQEMSEQFKDARRSWVLQRQELIGDLKQTRGSLEMLKSQLSGFKNELEEARGQIVSYKEKYEILSERSEEKDEEVVNLQSQLEDKEKIIARLQAENRIYNERFKQLQSESISSETSDKDKTVDTFGSGLSKWKEEKDILKEKLVLLKEKLNMPRVDKNEIIIEINETNELLERRIARIDDFAKQLETLMEKSKELAMNKAFSSVSTVELPPIVVKNQEGESLNKIAGEVKEREEVDKKLDSGKILLVRQADNFVIINLGKRNGVEENMMFEVFRGNQEVGNVKIIEVRDKLSGANIEKVIYGEMITANDSVKLIEY